MKPLGYLSVQQAEQGEGQPAEQEDWPISEKPRPLPPKKRTQKGRPQTKRRQEEGEKPRDPSKMSRAGHLFKLWNPGAQQKKMY